jgi:hypothetical protein
MPLPGVPACGSVRKPVDLAVHYPEGAMALVNAVTVVNETSDAINVTFNPWPTFFSLLPNGKMTLEQGACAEPGVEIDLADEGLFLFAGGSTTATLTTDAGVSTLETSPGDENPYLARGLEIRWPGRALDDSAEQRIFRAAVTDSRKQSLGVLLGRREPQDKAETAARGASRVAFAGTVPETTVVRLREGTILVVADALNWAQV